jgi:hypothetical protein
MPDARCQMPDAGCRMPDAGCRMQDAGCMHWSDPDEKTRGDEEAGSFGETFLFLSSPPHSAYPTDPTPLLQGQSNLYIELSISVLVISVFLRFFCIRDNPPSKTFFHLFSVTDNYVYRNPIEITQP